MPVFDEGGFDVTIHREADLAFGHVKAIRTFKVDACKLVA